MNEYVFKPTHKGLLCGIVPIHLDMSNPECPAIEVRGSGIGKFALEVFADIVEGAVGCYFSIRMMMNRDYEPMTPMLITGEITK